MKRFAVLAIAVAAALPAAAVPISILFVGNSYTFGRLDPVLTYNAANVRDLTKPQGPLVVGSTSATPKFSDVTGTNSYGPGMINPTTGVQGNSYSPHSQTQGWGGVPGIFKQLTVQAGLNYDVALSTRNAASLRGNFLNTANSTNWDLRGNIGSQSWDKMVLQEQSDEALGPQTVNGVALGSNYPAVQAYVNLIENWVHQGSALSYRERALYNAIHGNQANCVAAGGTTSSCDNNTLRTIPQNLNASTETLIYLQQTWARPNLINAPGRTTIDGASGDATYNLASPVPSYFSSLETMTAGLVTGMTNVADFAKVDGTLGIKGIIPVGQAFLTAVQAGLATRNMYASDALTDGLIDLWFNDGTHASVAGSYLSALTNFGSITGLDPAMFGESELAASALGLTGREAWLLQRVASLQLGFRNEIPEPVTLANVALGLLAIGLMRRRSSTAAAKRH
jgi:hypothetical protein